MTAHFVGQAPARQLHELLRVDLRPVLLRVLECEAEEGAQCGAARADVLRPQERDGKVECGRVAHRGARRRGDEGDEVKDVLH
jgi:hypothetical protein